MPEPPKGWQPGKTFYVTDDRIDRVFPNMQLRQGDLLIFVSFNYVPDIDGTNDTQVIFTSQSGKNLTYRVDKSPEEVAELAVLPIPFTVEMSLVSKAKDIFATLNQPLYIITRNWRDASGTPITGRKFVPVTIDSLTVGTAEYPLRLWFTDELAHHGTLLLSPSKDSPRTFASAFTFTNPRNKYPAVSPKHWPQIIAGMTTPGMTRDEVRLSLGTPSNLDRRMTYAGEMEVWSYEDGRYFTFMDGILQ